MVDGTSFGVPWYTETRLIYYRKDLAEKAGVTPEAGWNWDDLKAFAKAHAGQGRRQVGHLPAAGRPGLVADLSCRSRGRRAPS